MSANPFGLLGEDDSDDLTQLVIAARQLKPAEPVQAKKAPAPAAAAAAQAKMPSKPLPPSQAVREARNEAVRGGGRGRGRGRGVGGFNRDVNYGENALSGNAGGFRSFEDKDGEKSTERRGGYGGPRGSFRGGRRGGFNEGETDEVERPRRVYERHSGTGRGNEIKREGAGRRNWGTAADEIAPAVEEAVAEKEKIVENPEVEQDVDVTKEKPVEEAEEKEAEDKEMTLEEYEKILEEKRKALLALKPEERKVEADSEFKSMQQLSNKKSNDEIFIKLGSDKEKHKETTEKEEKVKKVVNINDFLKPAERERSGGRGRGRGRGARGGFNGRSGVSATALANIEDPGHFPALGVK
uniref:Hyaluronan/mRNA-binding protein domain-containing protein n=1 Tax=Kalanchoe fedtschenkoi TaxID=63787 RepID=A0A7N0VF18_KALFE